MKPGGKILAPLSGWSYAPGLVLLTVTGLGTATGRFLPGYTSFMIARPHDRPPRPTLARPPGDERPGRTDPAVAGTWTGGWVAQLASRAAERMRARPEQILRDVFTGSQARTAPAPDGSGWTVVQRGLVRLWNRGGTAVRLRQAASEPHENHHHGPHSFSVTDPLGELITEHVHGEVQRLVSEDDTTDTDADEP